MGTQRGHHLMAAPEDGAARLAVAHFKLGGLRTTTPCPGWTTLRGPYSSCSRATLQPRCARS